MIFDKGIIKNFLHLASSFIVSKLFLLVAIAVGARMLGPEQWGIFSYAFTILFIMHLLGDFGFHTLIMREVAKRSLSAQQFLKVIWSRFWLGLLSISLAYLALKITNADDQVLWVLGILSLSILLRPVYASVRSLSQGLEQMQWTMVLDVALYGTFLVVVALGLNLFYLSPIVPAIAWFVGVVISMVAAIYVYRKCQTLLIQTNVNIDSSQLSLIKMAAPFLMINVIVVIFHRVDVLMLEWFRGYEEVGYYSVAYQVFDAVALLPGLMVTVLFPRMLKYKSELRVVLPKMLFIVAILSSMIAFFTVLSADMMITTVFGDSYTKAIPLVPVLMLGVPLMATTGVLAHVLFTEQRTSLSAFATGISLVVNIALNYIFIPQYGMMAAGVATSVTLGLNSLIHILMVMRCFSVNAHCPSL
ncbi:flippase [Lutibacter sp.]|uniref:flippase n=1 Tax=Lutibacter sp. TaxID=1925666 RepID=UPI0025B7B233|nr:flippase [Lutibacter sp.]MCF6168100.1 flippase [Lutibacter sp.]